MNTLLIAIRAAVYMTGFVYFFGYLAFRVRAFDPQVGFRLPDGLQIPGLILGLAGTLLVLACAGEFITRGRGTPAPFDAPRRFVAAGPYKFVRNPMYVGGLLLLAAVALYLHSISILLMAFALFLVAHAFVFFYEEPTLRRTFGATYEEYCRNVRRWLPRRPKSSPSNGTQTV